ncbi:GAF domain-containing protein [candidate division CSSED10-310 bacterium]|uniref:GAF domain-containing protein n=1 Tax=candidate division CSSED10-310 bacterium TaxID=2855610 RepID=A0ABV6YWC4_UNCC1
MESQNNKENKLNFQKSRDFLEIFKSGKQFIEDILKENERLRFRTAKLEDLLEGREKDERDELIEQLKQKVVKLENKIESMEERFTDIEKENMDFAEKYIEIEEQNNNLANLYVASYQLHSTLNFNEVIKIVMEIVINLIGSEEFALYMVDEGTRQISMVASEGLEDGRGENITFGEGIIGKASEQGEEYYLSDLGQHNPDEPIAVIPMKIENRVIGLLAVFRLLSQKDGFSSVDHELFTLLAGHAATAILSARLYTESERKASTLKNFLDLLKSQ